MLQGLEIKLAISINYVTFIQQENQADMARKVSKYSDAPEMPALIQEMGKSMQEVRETVQPMLDKLR